MFAPQDPGLAIGAMPPPQAVIGPTDQLERRAVEATERGSLTTDDRRNVMYSSTAAVLQLLESSAQDYAAMLEVMDSGNEAKSTELQAGASLGQQLDVYA